MPRLFTGLELPAKLAAELNRLQGGIPGAKWIKSENYHLTLRFIGDIDSRTADEIAYALEQIRAWPFMLSLSSLNVFGNSKPHSLYVAAKYNDALMSLHQEHERIMQRIGLKPDGRKFTPHVTLARLRNCSDIDIAAWFSRHGSFSCKPINAGRFVLYSAKESTGGGPYVVERSYEFQSVPAE